MYVLRVICLFPQVAGLDGGPNYLCLSPFLSGGKVPGDYSFGETPSPGSNWGGRLKLNIAVKHCNRSATIHSLFLVYLHIV